MISMNGIEVMFTRFPNGESKLNTSTINLVNDLDFQKISFKYEDDSDLIKLMFVKNYLDSNFNGVKVDLTIYYMPYSRMDRVEGKSAFTLKYVANLINSLNFNKVRVIEPHSDVTMALLDRAEIIDVAMYLLAKSKYEIDFDKDKDYLFFPDNGAQKRYKGLTGYKQLVGYKDRDFKTGEIKSLKVVGDLEGDVSGSKILIVDDLSSYGGTFLHSADALIKLGFKDIYLQVVHAENSVFKGELLTKGTIKKVFTTNTIVSEQNDWGNAKHKDKIEIYDVEEFPLNLL